MWLSWGIGEPFGIPNISGEPIQATPAQLPTNQCSVVHDEVNTNTLDKRDIPIPAAG